MPIRQGVILASRASTWPRDHFCRSTMAPRASWPTTWNESHQFARILKAGQITDLSQHPHSRNEINPAHRRQGHDSLGERPLGQYLADGIFQTLHALAFLAYPLK